MKPGLERKAKKIRAVKRSKHDKIVLALQERLNKTTINGEEFYSDTIAFEEYGPTTRPKGEVDLQAYNNDYFLFFEIKSHHTRKNRKKAKEQLSRAEEYYVREFNRKRTFKFYVAGKRIEWIK